METPDDVQIEVEYNSDYSDEDELDLETSISSQNVQQKREEKKERGSVKMSTKLTPQLKGLMGEANLRFARGDTETAQQMCFEVIRSQPNAWEPYLTLSQIFEATDPSKCKGYLTIASYLNPSNSSTWCRLAEISLEEGNQKEALGLYTKCLNHDKKNIEVHRKRIKLAQELGDEHLILKFQEALINKLPEESHEEIIEVASNITKVYHEEKKYQKALSVLQIPFRTVPQHITPNLVNIMLELLLLTDQFSQCLDIFVDFCNFNFEIIVQSDGSISIKDYSMPANISIDLKTKFIICAIKLKCFDVAETLIDSIIIEEDVEVVGDLFLDICESLMALGQYKTALKLFVPLKKSKNYSLAGVWLKYSDCLAACDLIEQAIEGYFMVITLAPQHIEVIQPLAELLLKSNKKAEALDVMCYQTADRLNISVLILRSKVLRQIGDLDEYWKCIELLLSRHCVVFTNTSELKTILSGGRVADKIQRIQRLREFRNDFSEVVPNQNVICVLEPDVEEEYQLFRDALHFAMEIENYSQMQKLALMACTSKKFEKYFEEISLFGLLACFYNGDLNHGYYLARDAIVKHPDNNFLWNIFNMFAVSGDSRLSKFIYRFRTRVQDHEPSEILEANLDFYFANYNSALKYFMKEFRDNKSPYISFILGIITLHLSTISKHLGSDIKEQLLEITTYLFLYYSQCRSKMASQEIFFNLGRMYHHLGIMHLAEYYYKKVFDVENHLLSEYPEILCLKREAAFNLHLIYRKSGNSIAAKSVLMKYLVI
ncbi:hypothetical protein WA026_000279 [Henosepilachna vigintioctopunctata]|uniref:General transcription factor 3C polypeptide 3 n=1 Tax=Henosepilachna vigintioctopunctata TaxID=420089 RepID=A0AAW1UXY4_9CUCU